MRFFFLPSVQVAQTECSHLHSCGQKLSSLSVFKVIRTPVRNDSESWDNCTLSDENHWEFPLCGFSRKKHEWWSSCNVWWLLCSLSWRKWSVSYTGWARRTEHEKASTCSSSALHLNEGETRAEVLSHAENTPSSKEVLLATMITFFCGRAAWSCVSGRKKFFVPYVTMSPESQNCLPIGCRYSLAAICHQS